MPRSRAELPGLSLHSVPLATFGFLRFGVRPTPRFDRGRQAQAATPTRPRQFWAVGLERCTARPRFPHGLIDKIHDGPFGPTHLRALAHCLAGIRDGRSAAVPRYSAGTRRWRETWFSIRSFSATGSEGCFHSRSIFVGLGTRARASGRAVWGKRCKPGLRTTVGAPPLCVADAGLSERVRSHPSA